ncbi:putative transcriptional regulatory protein pdtaR [uncultured bacterium]|jgi:response regulator NasT|nr:putative transcriptional regulatory protein pdtaR [uncultured bacterium]
MKASTPAQEKKVLIAEDNPKTRLFLKNQLELLGYQVEAVSNGQAAVDMVSEVDPTLVIMDVKMPEMDGIDAARNISARKTIPIILITGLSSDEMATKAIESGVFAYLVKPVTKKQLEPAIKLAMARYDEFKSLKVEVDDLKDAIETRKLVERAKGILMKRCNITEEDAFKLLQTHSQKENKKMREIAETIVAASKLI